MMIIPEKEKINNNFNKRKKSIKIGLDNCRSSSEDIVFVISFIENIELKS